jgi:hypothetical protein
MPHPGEAIEDIWHDQRLPEGIQFHQQNRSSIEPIKRS